MAAVADSSLSLINNSVYNNANAANDAVQLLAKQAESATIVTADGAPASVTIEAARSVKLDISVNTAIVLAAPQYQGQIMVIECRARTGGIATLTTAASQVVWSNEVGAATATCKWDAAGETAVLVAMPETGKWLGVATSGVTLA